MGAAARHVRAAAALTWLVSMACRLKPLPAAHDITELPFWCNTGLRAFIHTRHIKVGVIDKVLKHGHAMRPDGVGVLCLV
jgi:hypothetical protein